MAKAQFVSEDNGVDEDVGVEVIEVAGVIKWFDVAKGFGFVVPDEPGLPDVLLHVTCLRRDGFQTAYEGSRVVCEAMRRQKGLQAMRVLSMDESTAIHPSQLPPSRTHVQVTASSGLEQVEVKWFNRIRGFGFLTRGDGTEDIFVHMETLRRFGITELRPGQHVLVRYGDGPKERWSRKFVRFNPAAYLRHIDVLMERRAALVGAGAARHVVCKHRTVRDRRQKCRK